MFCNTERVLAQFKNSDAVNKCSSCSLVFSKLRYSQYLLKKSSWLLSLSMNLLYMGYSELLQKLPHKQALKKHFFLCVYNRVICRNLTNQIRVIQTRVSSEVKFPSEARLLLNLQTQLQQKQRNPKELNRLTNLTMLHRVTQQKFQRHGNQKTSFS